MDNLTQEEIDALYVNFINKAVVHKDLTIEEEMKSLLLVNVSHKNQFIENLQEPDFFSRWGTIN